MEEEYWEGEFIEACFEEMLQEEEDREMIFYSPSCSELSFSTMDNSNKVSNLKFCIINHELGGLNICMYTNAENDIAPKYLKFSYQCLFFYELALVYQYNKMFMRLIY